MSDVPYTILGGYRGTGKNTLLNHLLSHNDGLRLALLINDFGAINIDSKLIEQRSENRINLTNGCVCCGLSAGFDEAIETLLATDPLPDGIVVEASGVADVISLAQYGHHPGLMLNGVLVVADAETVQAKARDKYVAATVTRQLQGADLIILNKIDLVQPERVVELQHWLRSLAPDTPTITTSHCAVPVGLLLGVESHRHLNDETPHPGHEDYVTWHFESSRPVDAAQVQLFIDALPDSVLRGKGFFNLASGGRLLYQQVGSRTTLEPTDRPGATELVIIGLECELNTDLLEAAARLLTATD